MSDVARAGGAPDTKACPYCAETILRAARKCRHCGEYLDDSLRPAAERTGYEWVGSQLELPPGSVVRGGRCLVCDGDRDVRPWRNTFAYTPPLAAVGLFGGLLPYILLHYLMVRKDEVVLPRCGPCQSRMRRNVSVRWIVGLGGLLACPAVGAIVGRALHPRDGAVYGLAWGFIAWVFALAIVAVWTSYSEVVCKRIDEFGTRLKFPAPDATRRALESPVPPP